MAPVPQARTTKPRVLITRAQTDAAPLAQAVRDAGGEPVCVPAVRTEVLPLDAALCDILSALPSYQAIAFASRNGVRTMHAALQAQGLVLPHTVPLFAVGPSTKDAVAQAFGRDALCAQPHTAHGLGLLLSRRLEPLDTVLLPTAQGAGDALVAALANSHIEATRLPLYATVAVSPVHAITGEPMTTAPRVDYIVFTSPSCVHGFVRWGWAQQGARVLCIGPSTARAAVACGMRVDGEAHPSSFAGLCALLKDLTCITAP